MIVPTASYIQTGFQDIIKIDISTAFEGEFLDLSEPVIQPNNCKFLDLFWFYDPDIVHLNNSEQQLQLVTFGINLNFGNLRINGYLNVESALHNQAFFITKELLTVNASIYPTGLFHIRNLENGEQYRPIEQLFVQYDPQNNAWHDELATTCFQKHNDKIKMIIERKNEQYFYIFKQQQYDMFNYALDYVLKGGFTLVGSKK